MSLAILGLLLLVAGLIAALIQALIAESKAKRKLRKYDSIVNTEEYQKQLETDIYKLENQQEFLNNEIRNLQQQFNEHDAKVYLQSIDYYEPKYEFVSSDDYLLRLKDIKSRQENMRKNKQAYICKTQLTLDNSKRKGQTTINNLLKLVEKAFENQCKYAIKEVKFNNVDSSIKKINSAFEQYNKCLQSLQCQISQEYLKLKLIELDLEYEYVEKKQEEKERENEIKKQRKEREAIEKARQKAEDAEDRERIHQEELEIIKQEVEQIEQVESEKRKQLELQIQELERQITEDRNDKENALSESKRLKSGYIYIVSNIGSFEKDIYRICMTSRGDEYIRDMNPSVPFKFDVHFKIFSEDVVDTLQRLHQRFNDKRVNIINLRRDFFKVSIHEIEQAVKQIKKQTGALRIDVFETTPQAYEYRQTLAAHRKKQQPNVNNQFVEVHESA
ncbi:MAG: DUF4041 domain-containing protein [Cyanobacteria bacterium P01_A01_bin.84]